MLLGRYEDEQDGCLVEGLNDGTLDGVTFDCTTVDSAEGKVVGTFDGLIVDGVNADGLDVDGIAVDGKTEDGVAVDGASVDGLILGSLLKLQEGVVLGS